VILITPLFYVIHLMRFKFSLIIFTAILWGTTSCTDFLDEDLSSRITLENDLFNTEETLLAALAGVYKPMSHTWVTGYGNAHTLGLLMGGDDLTTSKTSSKSALREFDRFNVDETNFALWYIWNGAYKSIQGANHIIAHYPNTSGDPDVIRQIAGEAFFLRAYNFFWLVRLWGDVPLMLESHYYNEGDLLVRPSPVSEVYTLVVEDLQMAEALMGNKKTDPGRASKGSAKALLAEVYLHMAGWPLNEVSYYELAANTARELIENEALFGFGLVEDFADLWPDSISNFDGNKEEVFALNFWGEEWWNTNAIYGNSGRPTGEEGWGDYMSELTFYYDFPEGYRKEHTFYTEMKDGTPWPDFWEPRPHFKKMHGPAPEYKNAISLPLERMAEVYLVFAEAQVMATGNSSDPDALEAINKIVRRGAGHPPNTPDPSVDWISATQDQIIREKGWEFAAEFCRWFDLVRLQKVEDAVANKDPDDMQPLGPIKFYMPYPAIDAIVNPYLTN
jgi:hypothetical protein